METIMEKILVIYDCDLAFDSKLANTYCFSIKPCFNIKDRDAAVE